jgi:hypothetical protein
VCDRTWAANNLLQSSRCKMRIRQVPLAGATDVTENMQMRQAESMFAHIQQQTENHQEKKEESRWIKHTNKRKKNSLRSARRDGTPSSYGCCCYNTSTRCSSIATTHQVHIQLLHLHQLPFTPQDIMHQPSISQSPMCSSIATTHQMHLHLPQPLHQAINAHSCRVRLKT